MFTFIFEWVGQLTDNYHSGGGLVVIARDEEQVKELVSTDSNIQLTDQEWKGVVKYRLVGSRHEPKLFIFPNAGCC